MRRNKGIFQMLIMASILIVAFASVSFAATSSTRSMTRTKNGSYYDFKDVTGKIKDQTYVYHKLVVPADGVMSVTGVTQDKKGIRMVLCNSKKKIIDMKESNFVRDNGSDTKYCINYAVIKGTYYIRVNTKSIGKGKRYALAARMKPCSNQGGSSSKPTVMKRGNKYTDVFHASAANHHEFYKFYTDGKSPVYLQIAHTVCQGNFYIKITGPSWPNGSKQNLSKASVTRLTLSRKNSSTGSVIGPKPGWYKIVFYRSQPQANGYFNLAWSN